MARNVRAVFGARARITRTTPVTILGNGQTPCTPVCHTTKISDEEITLNFHAGLPNAAPLVVDVNVTINEDVKEAKIVLQYADDDYYNATITSTSGSVDHTISSVKHSFSILTLPKIGVLKATPIEMLTTMILTILSWGGADSSMQTVDEGPRRYRSRAFLKCSRQRRILHARTKRSLMDTR